MAVPKKRTSKMKKRTHTSNWYKKVLGNFTKVFLNSKLFKI